MSSSTVAAGLGETVEGYARHYLDDREWEALASAGYGGSSGLGDRPALLVVDVTYGFCGPRGRSLLEAVATHPLASGESAWLAVPAIRQTVDAARNADVPIVFTRPVEPGRSAGSSRWDDKNRRQQAAPPDAFDLVADAGHSAGDIVLEKEAPSAFFGSPLLRWLTGWGCDSVVVCGGTTSGCVRATVVDAFSANLRVTVGADACFDRVRASHEVGMFDMGLKYADVRTAADIAQAFTACVAGPAVRDTRTEEAAAPVVRP